MMSVMVLVFLVLILAVAAVFPRLFMGLLTVFAGQRSPAPASARWMAGLATLFLLGITVSVVAWILFTIHAGDPQLLLAALPMILPGSFLGLCLLISSQRIADAIERKKDVASEHSEDES
jgi:hypothetical protein